MLLGKQKVMNFNRHWDINEEYKDYDLKVYSHWLVCVSTRQHTLGCCIIFCLRPGVWKYSELTTEEVAELIQVKKELEQVLNKTFENIHVNYCQYGNKVKVFHEHVIPRYEGQKIKLGHIWPDPNPSSLPAWSKKDEDPSLLLKIKQELLVNFEQ